MCDVLNLGIKNYYKYRECKDKDYSDYLLIKEIFDTSKGTYGYRRMHLSLKTLGFQQNEKFVRNRMKKLNR